MEELRKTLKSHKIKGKTLSECIGRIQQHQDLEHDWPTLLSQFSNVAETIHTLPKFLDVGGTTSRISVQPTHGNFDCGWVGLSRVSEIQQKKSKLLNESKSIEENNKNNKFVELTPGTVGMKISNQEITEVSNKALLDAEISEGWKILKIDSEPYSVDLLMEKKEGSKNYTVEFVPPPGIESYNKMLADLIMMSESLKGGMVENNLTSISESSSSFSDNMAVPKLTLEERKQKKSAMEKLLFGGPVIQKSSPKKVIHKTTARRTN